MNISGKIVTLRAPELDDLNALHEWSNDPDIWNMLSGWHFPFSKRSTEEWIKTRKDNNLNNHVFCIDTKEHGIIGTANLVNIDWKNKNAFHGLMIGRSELRGKGYALDAIFSLMRYVFMELGLNRLESSIIAYNHRSLKFYTEKAGWKQEGVCRNWFYRNGSFHDKIMVGITLEDYLDVVAKSNYWCESNLS